MSTPHAGRVAVITGATRGLGAGLAEAFAAAGLRLGLCGRSVETEQSSPDLVSRRCDVTDPEDVDRFARDVMEQLGPIDLWINNAGVLGEVGPARDLPPADFARTLAVNLLGVLHGSQTYARHLREAHHSGVLINISSGAARKPIAGWSAYCASKAAVDRLTECLALEEAPHLRALSVAPGVIDTDMQAAIRAVPAERFPLLPEFIELKEDDAFSSSAHVARRLLELAFDPARVGSPVLLRLDKGR